MDPTAAHSIVATRVSNVAQGSQVCTKSLPWGNFLDPSNHSFEAPIKISDVDYEDASQEYYVHTLVGYYVGHITSKTWFGFGYMKLKSIRLACCQYQKPDQGFLHVVHIKKLTKDFFMFQFRGPGSNIAIMQCGPWLCRNTLLFFTHMSQDYEVYILLSFTTLFGFTSWAPLLNLGDFGTSGQTTWQIYLPWTWQNFLVTSL